MPVTTADIEKIFERHLALIESEDVRQKLVAAWVLAAKMGKKETIEEVLEMPFTLLTATHGVTFVEHTLAVTDGAIGLAKAQAVNYKHGAPYSVDMDVLIAGGILHDVGKLQEIERAPDGTWRKSYAGKCARHPISGAIFCAMVGLPEPYLNVTGCHAKEGDGRPKVIETILIHQADFATFDPMKMLNDGLLIQ